MKTCMVCKHVTGGQLFAVIAGRMDSKEAVFIADSDCEPEFLCEECYAIVEAGEVDTFELGSLKIRVA